jgi:RpiB/LacA/LacB family sugar-phosphate isomerase
MDSLELSQFNLIFILREDQINNFQYDEILKQKFGNKIKIAVVSRLTGGAVESCLAAKKYIDNKYPLSIYTVDVNFFPKYNKSTFKNNEDGGILTFKSNSENHSYALIKKNGEVIKTVEKKVISNNALVGVYYFKKGSIFVKYGEKMIRNNLKSSKEYYIAPLYNLIINDKLKVSSKEIKKLHLFGTPEELNFFENKTVKTFKKVPIGICSDHSGYDLKSKFINFLKKNKIDYVDYGCYSNKPCDYYDYVKIAKKGLIDKVVNNAFSFCKSGQGVNIAANNTEGNTIGALVYNIDSLEMSIRHNCANFFSFPSNIWKSKDFKLIWSTYIKNTFDGGRHQNRINKIFKSRK